jgi:hypothetical protein
MAKRDHGRPFRAGRDEYREGSSTKGRLGRIKSFGRLQPRLY